MHCVGAQGDARSAARPRQRVNHPGGRESCAASAVNLRVGDPHESRQHYLTIDLYPDAGYRQRRSGTRRSGLVENGGTCSHHALNHTTPGRSRGKRSVKVEPLPGALLTESVPPSISAYLRATLSPMPVPPTRRVRDCSTCQKGSKIRGRFWAEMPILVSLTSRTTPSPSPRTCRLTP